MKNHKFLYPQTPNLKDKVSLLVVLFVFLLQTVSFAEEIALNANGSHSNETAMSKISEISPEQAVQKQMLNEKNGIIPDPQILKDESPLQAVDVSEDIKETSKVSFSDLHFDPKLSDKGEVKISDHESILFQKDAVISNSYGNQVSLNLNDQKMMSITYVGYVLGPFTPSQDYLDVYFDTIGSIQGLIDKAAQSESKKDVTDAIYISNLKNAKQTLNEFVSRAKKVKEESLRSELNHHLQDAINRYYEGEIPSYESLSFEEKNEGKKSSYWEAEMILNQSRIAGKVQRRIFTLKTIRDDFAVVDIKEEDFSGNPLLSETYDYDSAFILKDHRIKTFYANGKLKTDHDLKYEDGLKSSRYYREFSESGARERFLNETFYQDGNTKTSTDYQYTTGKKLFYKFNSDGRVIHSATEPISSKIPA